MKIWHLGSLMIEKHWFRYNFYVFWIILTLVGMVYFMAPVNVFALEVLTKNKHYDGDTGPHYITLLHGTKVERNGLKLWFCWIYWKTSFNVSEMET